MLLKRRANHPMHSSPICPTCIHYESEKRRINATPREFAKHPCDDHIDAVSPACLKCLMWAAHGNDLKGEK